MWQSFMLMAGLCLLPSCRAAGIAQGTVTQQGDRGNSMIAKVIEMLGEEKDKIKVDLAKETETMAEYMGWCDDTQDKHFYGIKHSNSKLEELSAEILDATAQISSLDEELAELGNEIAERESEIEEAIAIREKDHEVFLKVEAEQVAAVEQLEEMGVALKKQIASFTATPPPVPVEGEEGAAEEAALLQKKSPAASFDAFLQINNKNKLNMTEIEAAKQTEFNKMTKALKIMVNAIWVDPETKKKLGAFIQEEPNIDAHDGLPEGESAGGAMAAMVAQNEANLQMFEGLKGKAEEALQKARDEETKKQGEHDVQMMTLKQAIALAENNVDDAKRERARLAQEKAEAEEEKVDVEATKAADEKALQETKLECDATSEAWAHRQSEAKAEMAAIDKAKEILASRVTVFIQFKGKASSSPQSADSLQQTIKAQKTRQVLINHFRKLGNNLHSLAMLNLVSVAAQDPMENVKNLLKDLITKLEKEAKEAADLHAFCQAEKKKTKEAMEKKNMEIDKLDVRIETASTTKEQLQELIATNAEEIANTEAANAEATKLRTEQNANFVKVDTDFSGAAEAVDDAIDALKEYYGEALLQTNTVSKDVTASGTDAPPAFGGAKSDSAGGIVGILETMGEEFRKTVKEARATEREQVKGFETLMQENKVLLATMESEIKGAESQIKSLDVSIHDSSGDLKMVQKEKGAIEDYIAKLKPQCGGRVVPYEERKAKREAEIAGLKEGLSILEAESPAGAFASFLQVQKHVHA